MLILIEAKAELPRENFRAKVACKLASGGKQKAKPHDTAALHDSAIPVIASLHSAAAAAISQRESQKTLRDRSDTKKNLPKLSQSKRDGATGKWQVQPAVTTPKRQQKKLEKTLLTR